MVLTERWSWQADEAEISQFCTHTNMFVLWARGGPVSTNEPIYLYNDKSQRFT